MVTGPGDVANERRREHRAPRPAQRRHGTDPAADYPRAPGRATPACREQEYGEGAWLPVVGIAGNPAAAQSLSVVLDGTSLYSQSGSAITLPSGASLVTRLRTCRCAFGYALAIEVSTISNRSAAEHREPLLPEVRVECEDLAQPQATHHRKACAVGQAKIAPLGG